MAKKKAAKKKIVSAKVTQSIKKKTAAAKAKKPRAPKGKPTPPTVEEIRTAAYLNYTARAAKGKAGDALGDWLAAESGA